MRSAGHVSPRFSSARHGVQSADQKRTQNAPSPSGAAGTAVTWRSASLVPQRVHSQVSASGSSGAPTEQVGGDRAQRVQVERTGAAVADTGDGEVVAAGHRVAQLVGEDPHTRQAECRTPMGVALKYGCDQWVDLYRVHWRFALGSALWREFSRYSCTMSAQSQLRCSAPTSGPTAQLVT
jgi:hypothetical protein